ncbi:penicillin acylase family protein [Qingshengfaniella alkalisoli]|uniref:Penicillin acylase family protein n=1 Tax=Qingshengfaniella alkalisoli TaxID=2599296 RepID=A0A5B8IU72_9RHOB|nr:penicillin acylase family protein [Qingshengfaniella alkalisoli]QDY69033.1 penicillin acylase family protein [Qingshengfaniella alkalisoli]
MTRVFRWMFRLFIGLSACAAIAVAGVYYLAARSLPDYSEDYTVAGVAAPVEIVRDTANVPHIFGETDQDTFFGLGFVHAQDRLWQMTMMRRTAQGRLSELFGERTIGIDETMRRLDLYRLAERSFAVQDDQTKAALEAYAAGVNAWLAQVNDGARGRGAPEFFLFQPSIAPWRPADSLAVIKLMALQLSSHMDAEILRARAALSLPAERLTDILPDDPSPPIAALPEFASLMHEHGATRLSQGPQPDFRNDPLSPIKHAEFAGASNAWAAAPNRTTTTSTLLANDPHLGLTAPSIWYLARLELQSGGVIGGTIPGMPLVLAGRNDAMGWGLTTAYVDDTDLYLEQINPDNPDEYLTEDGYRPFRTERTIIPVKDSTPVTLTMRWVDDRPVLPSDVFDLNQITPDGYATSIAWTALDGQDTSMSAGMALMRAQSVDEAIDAGRDFIAPAQNLTLADGDTIALQTIGAMPSRSENHETYGRIPSRGWLADNHWQGYLDYAENPQVVDPAGGIVGNTNNKTVDRPFPRHVSYTWGDSQRVHRWEKLMQDREVHTRESFMEVQLDTISITARTLLPLIGADLWFTGEAAAEGTVERRRRDALDLLADWNGEMSEHLPQPLIYATWVRALQARLITDELGGTLTSEFARVDPVFLERVFRDVDGASVWCDVVQSTPTESCELMARASLDDALQWISENFRGSLDSLRWGDVHVATHDHAVLGDVPILSWFVNIRQSTSGGDNTLMRGVTRGSGPNPFENVHGAGYRGIYDMADPDSSLFVISTGQSGHPLSRYYDNLGELWRRGEYVPMSLDPELARAASAGTTWLTPPRQRD